MKRKVYVTARERKVDRMIGFCAFPIVNVLLWIIAPMFYPQLPTQAATTDLPRFMPVDLLFMALPWLVNGTVLALAFLFRPEFGVGYIAFVAVAITVVVVLSILFVAACFVYALIRLA